MEEGYADGDVDVDFDMVKAAVDYLADQPGWTAELVDRSVTLIQDGTEAEDLRLVEAGLANALFFHAIEHAGAAAYFYVVQAMHADGGDDLDAAWLFVDGQLHEQLFDGDFDAAMTFRGAFGARTSAADAAWTVDAEAAEGGWTSGG